MQIKTQNSAYDKIKQTRNHIFLIKYIYRKPTPDIPVGLFRKANKMKKQYIYTRISKQVRGAMPGWRD